MQGIERVYCDVCVGALISAWRALFEASATEGLNRVPYGKGDTLGLDAIPEIIITKRITEYDEHAMLVTEELDLATKRRWPTDSDRSRQPLMFFSDPTDRSKQLRKFIEVISRGAPLQKIGRLMGREKCVTAWEAMFEPPAAITGATTSITCVRKGSIIFSVVLNYITQTIFVAATRGIFQLRLPPFTDRRLDQINLEYIVQNGHHLRFPPAKESCKSPDDFKRFVTFLGKSGYRENFNDCMIFLKPPDEFLHHTEPGGPSRIFYLSELQQGHGPIGFVMANGEKIGEWIHWLAFVKYARTQHGEQRLKVYEVSTDRPWVKDSVLMSTSPPYSIFCSDGDQTYLDISRLRHFVNPSKFRSMLVITPFDNERIIHIMRQHNYREIDLS